MQNFRFISMKYIRINQTTRVLHMTPWFHGLSLDFGAKIRLTLPTLFRNAYRFGPVESSLSSEWISPNKTVLHSPLNPKETSWGLKGPVAYISYHCVSLKNRFLLKRYVFLKNIVLDNIMCETKWIVITTKFYRFFCEKVTQKTETGLLGPGWSSCVIQTKWHIYKKMP